MSALDELGAFIRQRRQQAQISLRQLADKTGVSNPYLSQIERGLRKPSADVLRQLAEALRVGTPDMFRRAGLLPPRDDSDVRQAIEADTHLTEQQKNLLLGIYQKFLDSTKTQGES
ncbi:MAG: helix-turn-helix transcriptional regulator [Corynebacteriales bacterium]|nr:helix-turn-helix transcriptional regulator [Mycobacteriales bacterium]